jgi:phage recombination protein Bet
MTSRFRPFLIIGGKENTEMSRELVEVSQESKLVQQYQGEWTRSQVELLKNTVCKGATDDEFKIFCYAVKRTGLDPFMKQIHAVKRWNNKTGREDMSIQVGIDGYRLIAERTGLYAGNEDTVFDNEQNPTKATHTVYKIVHGARCAFTASARWSEYYPGDKQGFMWKKMPCVMLGKVAETLALRKAFPNDLSGIYTNEEMAQAGGDDSQRETPKTPSDAQLKRLFAISKSQNVSNDQIKTYLEAHFKKGSTRELTIDEYNRLCDDMQAGKMNIAPMTETVIEEGVIEPVTQPQELPWEKYMNDPQYVK